MRPITFHVVTAGWPVRIVLHPPAARCVLRPSGKSMRPSSLRRPALDHRPIGLADACRCLNSRPSSASALRWRPSTRQPEVSLVEPVRQRRRARQAEAQRVEIVLEALAPLRPLVHGEARRLVDHQHQPVAVEQASYYLFRCHDAKRLSRAFDERQTRTQRKAGGSACSGGLKRTSRRSAARSPISSPSASSTQRCSTRSRRC